NSITANLVDAGNDEPVGFATVSLIKKGATKPSKYVLSTESGFVKITEVRNGEYTLKAELLGYLPVTKEIVVKGDVALGRVEMKTDNTRLDAATVSAVGNSVIMKKDTIEYNATAFKTTDNDVLEDLLKKLPGVDVAEDGTISVNGETIKKITIDGKTFFLDDPQLASKNIPAKIINKLKVVEKKSDQAAFTGIDDGEEETVIDLSIKPGMMKGAFGNIMAGGGHDLMPDTENWGDARYQAAAFLGNFTKTQQLSLIANANNTNNRGFNDMAGSMMGNMRGGGGGRGRGQGGWGRGNGITTSYMAGVNGAWDLFGDKMDLGGNYLFNHTGTDVLERSTKTVYQGDDNSLIYKSNGTNNTVSNGHRFGMRLEHKFSENTSIVFEPQFNFGTGSYTDNGRDTTYRNDYSHKLNEAYTDNAGSNKSFSTSGFLLLRQRLGLPGRTLTAMTRFSFSNNELNGLNTNGTTVYNEDGSINAAEGVKVSQRFDNTQQASSIMGRLTYTEPIGNHFYVEANYMYRWNRSTSDKETYETETGTIVDAYTSKISNTFINQSMGANLLYQTEKIRAQIGFAAKPTKTTNKTQRASSPVDTTMMVWNFSPQAMIRADFNDNNSLRMFYFGNSSQPSINQLIPIPDNSDPLNVSFGNPALKPSFSHSMRGDYRFSQKKKFLSVNVRFNASLNQNPVVSALWYGDNGAQYTMPLNGHNTASAGFSTFGNFPIKKSNFTLSNMTRINWNLSNSMVGKDIPSSYILADGDLDYAAFLRDYDAGLLEFTDNKTNTISVIERLRLQYRLDNLELQTSARTRVNKSWYSISSMADKTTTWNNQLRFSVNWTVEPAGLTLKSEFNYNWYRGYTTPQPSEYILDAELQKLLFKKKLTLALKCYDIFNQSKNLTVTDNSNYHQESWNNTLGRYIILSATFRFGQFDKSKMRNAGGYGRMR
ncbi:MAG: outer membrane beta-barrel protein, partial [Bacteroidales bacterium]|nr:outer membrane beta-barrel protein [Bacteroidales bacterium]